MNITAAAAHPTVSIRFLNSLVEGSDRARALDPTHA
jgi:hypothetical protein